MDPLDIFNTCELDLSWYEPQSFLWEPIQLGLVVGLCLSFPLNPAFLVPFRQSLLKKRAGLFCLSGTFFGYFLCLVVFLFSPPTLLKNFYVVEPLLNFLGLCVVLRFAGALGFTTKYAVGAFRFQSSFWQTVRRPIQPNEQTPTNAKLIPQFEQFSKFEQNLPYSKNVYNLIAKEQVSPLALVHNTKQAKMRVGRMPRIFKNQYFSQFLKIPFIRDFVIRITRRRSKYTRPNAFDTLTPRGGLYTFAFKSSNSRDLQDDDGIYFILGFFLIFANPWLWLPFPSLLYSLQFDHIFDLLIFTTTSLSTIIVLTLGYLLFFRRFFPPLFFGEVTKLAFFIDSFFAFLLIFGFALGVSEVKTEFRLKDIADYVNNMTNTKTLTNLGKKYLPEDMGAAFFPENLFKLEEKTLANEDMRGGLQDQHFWSSHHTMYESKHYEILDSTEKTVFFDRFRREHKWPDMNDLQRSSLIDMYEYDHFKRKRTWTSIVDRIGPMTYRYTTTQKLFTPNIGLSSFLENYSKNLPYLRGHYAFPEDYDDPEDLTEGDYLFGPMTHEDEDEMDEDFIPPPDNIHEWEELDQQEEITLNKPDIELDPFSGIWQYEGTRKQIRMSSIGLDRVYFINFHPDELKVNGGPATKINPKEPTSLTATTYKPLFRFERPEAEGPKFFQSSSFLQRLSEIRSSANSFILPVFEDLVKDKKEFDEEFRPIIKPIKTFKEMIPYNTKWIWDLDENKYIYPSKYYMWGSQDLGERDVKSIYDHYYTLWELNHGLRGYPHFSYTRLNPVSDDDFIKLRSDLLIYRKLLKTEFY